jgi:serine/threonine-protein kinase
MSEGARLQLGAYRTLKAIGRGGMGNVYLAERVDGQFRHRVAIKIVPGGLQDEEAVERFRHERQILARLEHPGIARLLDGGVSADGRPYLVMEYVEGEPLTRYCDSRRLGIDARLRLFRAVCLAVEHAHQNLIVHCDLKPSNVLASADGSVRLLDFGIAALVSPGAGGTGSSPGALTLGYASPEQMRGQPVSTASDVYGLGVILGELLAGHRPYRLPSRTL